MGAAVTRRSHGVLLVIVLALRSSLLLRHHSPSFFAMNLFRLFGMPLAAARVSSVADWGLRILQGTCPTWRPYLFCCRRYSQRGHVEVCVLSRRVLALGDTVCGAVGGMGVCFHGTFCWKRLEERRKTNTGHRARNDGYGRANGWKCVDCTRNARARLELSFFTRVTSDSTPQHYLLGATSALTGLCRYLVQDTSSLCDRVHHALS